MAESRRRARPKSQEGFFRRLFPRYENTSVDLTFLVMVILLLVFGLVMMFSASYAQGYYREGNSYHYIVRQLLWAVVGLGAMFVFSRMDYHVWRKLAWPLFPVVTAMLILCYFMPPVNDALAGFSSAVSSFSPRSWLNSHWYCCFRTCLFPMKKSWGGSATVFSPLRWCWAFMPASS